MPMIDEWAFAKLYHEHAGHVTAYVLRRCDRDDAADIVSETFLVCWRRFNDIPPEPMTRAWLYGVARKVIANHRRGVQRRSNLRDRIAGQIEVSLQTTPDPAKWQTAAGDLTDALQKLRPDDRELLFLAAWEELTPAEIAQVVDLPARIVHKRLFRARGRLKEALQEMPPPPCSSERNEASSDARSI